MPALISFAAQPVDASANANLNRPNNGDLFQRVTDAPSRTTQQQQLDAAGDDFETILTTGFVASQIQPSSAHSPTTAPGAETDDSIQQPKERVSPVLAHQAALASQSVAPSTNVPKEPSHETLNLRVVRPFQQASTGQKVTFAPQPESLTDAPEALHVRPTRVGTSQPDAVIPSLNSTENNDPNFDPFKKSFQYPVNLRESGQPSNVPLIKDSGAPSAEILESQLGPQQAVLNSHQRVVAPPDFSRTDKLSRVVSSEATIPVAGALDSNAVPNQVDQTAHRLQEASISDSHPNTRLANRIADAIVTRSQVVSHKGTTQFEIQLDPPELGSVWVHLTSSKHGLAARIVVAEQTTFQVIESHLPSLRQSLEHSGISLQGFDVSHHGPGPQDHQGDSEPLSFQPLRIDRKQNQNSSSAPIRPPRTTVSRIDLMA